MINFVGHNQSKWVKVFNYFFFPNSDNKPIVFQLLEYHRDWFPIFSGKTSLLKMSLKYLIPSFFNQSKQIKIRIQWFVYKIKLIIGIWLNGLFFLKRRPFPFFEEFFLPAFQLVFSNFHKKAAENMDSVVYHVFVLAGVEHRHFLHFLMVLYQLEVRNQTSSTPNWLPLELQLKQMFPRILPQFVFLLVW